MMFETISVLPTLICLFWAVVLLVRSKHRNRAKCFLSLFMLVAALLYACHAAYFNHLNSPTLDTLYIGANLSVYPLYLLYIRKLTSTTASNKKTANLIFALPVAVATLIGVLYVAMPSSEVGAFVTEHLYGRSAALESGAALAQQWVHRLTPLLFAAEVVYVVVVGTRLIVGYNAELKRYYSSDNGRSLRTIRNLMFAFVATSICSMTVNIIGKAYFAENQWLLAIPSLLFGIMLFLVGLAGMNQNFSAEEFASEMLTDPKPTTAISAEKYLKIGAQIEQLFAAERPYLNDDYKITDLAVSLHTNRTYISNTINSLFGCNFSDYVNRYRVEQAKALLLSNRSNEKPQKNIGIFEQAGFQSESSFYRIFKEQTGMTPRQFVEKG